MLILDCFRQFALLDNSNRKRFSKTGVTSGGRVSVLFMHKPTRQFVFQRVYDTAALIEECIEDEESIIELDWDNPIVIRGLAKFSKLSLLHRYIFAMIYVEHHREYRKNSDMYESSEDVAPIEKLFDAYGISYQPYISCVPSTPTEKAQSQLEDPFYQ